MDTLTTCGKHFLHALMHSYTHGKHKHRACFLLLAPMTALSFEKLLEMLSSLSSRFLCCTLLKRQSCTTECQQAANRVEEELAGVISMERNTGVTIAGDGWSDCKRQPLLNFIAVSPAGCRFISSLNTQGKNAESSFKSFLLKIVAACMKVALKLIKVRSRAR